MTDMDVVVADEFDYECPETFNWGAINENRFRSVAKRIVNIIEWDLNSEDRNFVPGLREALRVIALKSTILKGAIK